MAQSSPGLRLPQPPKQGVRGTLLFAWAVLTIVIGWRFKVGTDWPNYITLFSRISRSSFWDGLKQAEPSYAALNWVAGHLGLGLPTVNFICAGIFAYALIAFCMRERSPYLGLLVALPYLIIVVAMGYTRQGVAIGLCMLAITYFLRGKLVKSGLVVILAVTFHQSTLIVVPLIALANQNKRLVTSMLIIMVGVLGFYLLSDRPDELYSFYARSRYDSLGALVRLSMNVVAAVIYFPLRKQLFEDPAERRLWGVFSIAAMVLALLLFLLASSTVVDRVALYLIPLQIAVLGRLPSALPRIQAYVLVMIASYCFFIQFVWLNYAVYAKDWIPYRNILFSG